ncbi:MAG: YceI family protein [Chloroflexota bacterium]
MSSAPATQPSGSGRGRRLAIVGVVGTLAAILIGVFLVWLVFFSSEAPEAPTIEGAAAVLDASPPAGAPRETGKATGTGAGTDGTWVVDTSIGNAAGGGGFVGFRVAEVLDLIGATEAIGRTSAVSGELQLEGSTLKSASIEADLRGLVSDQPRREPAIHRALQTRDFPMARFESSAPVDLGVIPSGGETWAVSVPGTLTVRGISQGVNADMRARLIDDVVAVVGSLPVDFTSFGITMPSAPIVVSVEDSGDLEWQLFFRREG